MDDTFQPIGAVAARVVEKAAAQRDIADGMPVHADPGVIDKPGFYDLVDARYHADPVIEPSLSSSMAVTLLQSSPRHAWIEHPRLGASAEEADDEESDRAPTRAMEIGTVVHALLLGRGADIVQIDAPAYRAKESKEARAAAYAAGKSPILAPDMRKVERIVAAAREQLAADPETDDMLDHGFPEIVIAWRDKAGPWCRAMLDHLKIGRAGATITDLKTSAVSINPNERSLGWRIADMGYEARAAFYERGLVTLMPDLAGRIRFRHVWLETAAPYSLVVSEMDGGAQIIGAKKASAAIGIWHRCLSAGTAAKHWPRYGSGVHRIDYPARAENDWLEREMTDPDVQAALRTDPFLNSPISPPLAPKHRAQLDTLMGG